MNLSFLVLHDIWPNSSSSSTSTPEVHSGRVESSPSQTNSASQTFNTTLTTWLVCILTCPKKPKVTTQARDTGPYFARGDQWEIIDSVMNQPEISTDDIIPIEETEWLPSYNQLVDYNYDATILLFFSDRLRKRPWQVKIYHLPKYLFLLLLTRRLSRCY